MSLTSRLPLSRSRIDRDAASRKIPGFLEDLMAKDSTRVVMIWRGEALLAPEATTGLDLVTPHTVPDDALLIYLGITTESTRGIPGGNPHRGGGAHRRERPPRLFGYGPVGFCQDHGTRAR